MDNRESYKEKFVKDLKDGDIAAISGIIINRSDNSLVIDDSSGEIIVGMNNSAEQGTYVRVFGRVIGYEEGLQMQGEILQSLDKIDKKLHKKVKELLNKE